MWVLEARMLADGLRICPEPAHPGEFFLIRILSSRITLLRMIVHQKSITMATLAQERGFAVDLRHCLRRTVVHFHCTITRRTRQNFASFLIGEKRFDFHWRS